MKEEKFKVINFIRELIVYIDKYLINFPKKDIEIKNKIKNESYDLLEIGYKANVTSNKDKKEELVEDMIAKKKIAKINLLWYKINKVLKNRTQEEAKENDKRKEQK